MSFAPQTQIWPDPQYIPGSLQCDVLTRHGLACGNVIGQGRCLDYCARLTRHWDGKLLPLAIKLAMTSVPDVYTGYYWTRSMRPALYFWNLPATSMQLQLVFLRNNQPIYRNIMTVMAPTTDEGCHLHFQLPIQTQDETFLPRLRKWLHDFCRDTSLYKNNDMVEFDLVIPQGSTVGVVVNIALQIMLLDALQHRPFSMALQYILPDVVVDGMQGVRFKNTQALVPEYDLSSFY